VGCRGPVTDGTAYAIRWFHVMSCTCFMGGDTMKVYELIGVLLRCNMDDQVLYHETYTETGEYVLNDVKVNRDNGWDGLVTLEFVEQVGG